MLFCKHDFEKVSEVILESAFEQMRQGATDFKMRHMDPILFQKLVVIVLVCRKCGRVKVIKERNPSL